jgi:hypothetical protein
MYSSCLFPAPFHIIQVVPCFVRRQFNNIVGTIFFVRTSDAVQYKCDVQKGSSKTLVCGSGYKKFLHDYDLQVGDYIMLEIHNAPDHFGIFAQGSDGIPKDRLEGNLFLVLHECNFVI